MGVNITLVNSSAREQATHDHLLELLGRYDLRRWQFTEIVQIDQSVVPHSHPILTLNACPLDDGHLLGVYIHEQLHWFLMMHEARVQVAFSDLRKLYPVVPVGLPEGGKDEQSTYLHLLVNWLEYAALVDVVGPDEARRVVMERPFYTWIYAAVLRDYGTIEEIIQLHNLMPG